MFLASFLLVQERWSLKPLGFSETKELKMFLDSCFCGNNREDGFPPARE
jgi:hypothetical protein